MLFRKIILSLGLFALTSIAPVIAQESFNNFTHNNIDKSVDFSNENFNNLINAGGWSTTADDNVSNERLPNALINNTIKRYKDHPNSLQNIADIGLLVLTLSVAEWGVDNAKELPTDPAGKEWKGPAPSADGKHLMSYSKGGVGIAHLDAEFLVDLFKYIKINYPDLAPDKEKFFALQGIRFDRLYANGGHCKKPLTVIMTDLDNKPFEHMKHGYAGTKYCSLYHDNKTDEQDWRIFRHWIRAALRKQDIQKWIVLNWTKKYWLPSYYAIVDTGAGSIEDVMINARIRNSSSKTAECAFKAAKNSKNRIATQLDYYKRPECGGNPRHGERAGFMKRPITLFQQIKG
jgi:hypothetical protein